MKETTVHVPRSVADSVAWSPAEFAAGHNAVGVRVTGSDSRIPTRVCEMKGCAGPAVIRLVGEPISVDVTAADGSTLKMTTGVTNPGLGVSVDDSDSDTDSDKRYRWCSLHHVPQLLQQGPLHFNMNQGYVQTVIDAGEPAGWLHVTGGWDFRSPSPWREGGVVRSWVQVQASQVIDGARVEGRWCVVVRCPCEGEDLSALTVTTVCQPMPPPQLTQQDVRDRTTSWQQNLLGFFAEHWRRLGVLDAVHESVRPWLLEHDVIS